MAFKKGKSGNPGGKKKDTPDVQEVRAYAKSLSMEAIKKLKYWMDNGSEKASVSACSAILDRGLGKPTQEVEHTGGVSIAILETKTK